MMVNDMEKLSIEKLNPNNYNKLLKFDNQLKLVIDKSYKAL